MKKTLMAAVLATGLFASCLGPNKMFNRLHEWNHGVSENRWVNEAVFVAFNIIPVYGVAYLADIIIFNSIEWWGGDSPMDDNGNG